MKLTSIIREFETRKQEEYRRVNQVLEQQRHEQILQNMAEQAEQLAERSQFYRKKQESLKKVAHVEKGYSQELEQLRFLESEEYRTVMQNAPQGQKQEYEAKVGRLKRKVGKEYFQSKGKVETMEELSLESPVYYSDKAISIILPLSSAHKLKDDDLASDLYNHCIKVLVGESSKLGLRAGEENHEGLKAVHVEVPQGTSDQKLDGLVRDFERVLNQGLPKSFHTAKVSFTAFASPSLYIETQEKQQEAVQEQLTVQAYLQHLKEGMTDKQIKEKYRLKNGRTIAGLKGAAVKYKHIAKKDLDAQLLENMGKVTVPAEPADMPPGKPAEDEQGPLEGVIKTYDDYKASRAAGISEEEAKAAARKYIDNGRIVHGWELGYKRSMEGSRKQKEPRQTGEPQTLAGYKKAKAAALDTLDASMDEVRQDPNLRQAYVDLMEQKGFPDYKARGFEAALSRKKRVARKKRS